MLTMQEIQVQSLGQEAILEKGMVTHSSILAWKIPMDRGTWRATVHGVTKSWTGLPRGFSRVAAGFSSYDGDLSLPLGLALGSPIFPSGCEGKLGVALESLQGRRDLFGGLPW